MKMNHDIEWDKIDKKTDLDSGHFVVPTAPGKADTSEVSEYIRKQKKQQTMNEKKSF